MITVDPRDGSKDLIDPLRAMGLDVDEFFLPAGDLEFTGRGAGGAPVTIGVEFKRLGELIDAMRSERLQGHQLIAMRGAEPGERPRHDFAWLLWEGEILFDKSGVLCKKGKYGEPQSIPGRMTVSEFYKRLFDMQIEGGLVPLQSENRRQTLKIIEALYRNWTDKDRDAHRSHLAIYHPKPLIPVSQFRFTVSTLPSVAFNWSAAAEKAFDGSIRRAINANAKHWADLAIKGKDGVVRHFGMKRAETLEEAIK